jgi:hypothetical protein
MKKLKNIFLSDTGSVLDEYVIRLACPNLLFITSLLNRPNAPILKPNRIKR